MPTAERFENKPEVSSNLQIEAATNQASFPRKNLKPLTGLRIFPALAVVLHHIYAYFSCLHGIDNYYTFVQAVTLFFMLSGFILTYIYFDMSDAKTVGKFYIARLARIWPAHAACLIFLIFAIPEVFKVKSTDLPLFFANLFMVHSWIPLWKTYFSYNAPSWSNSTDIFLYLCFPLLIWGMKKRWYAPLLLSSTLLVSLFCICVTLKLPVCSATGLSAQGLLYVSPVARLFDFSVGMTGALLFARTLQHLKIKTSIATILEALSVLAVCLLNFYCAFLQRSNGAPNNNAIGYWALESGPCLITFIMLILIFACGRGHISRFLSTKPMVVLGEISFSLYLLHGVLITYLSVNFPQEQGASTLVVFLAAVLIMSHLLSELVEKPCRKIIVKFGNGLLDRSGNKSEATADFRWSKKHFLLASEAAILCLLVYFGMPGIKPVDAATAGELAKTAAVKNIDLSPCLQCSSASATAYKDSLSVKLVWTALKEQPVDFRVKASVLDKSGHLLAAITEWQDWRKRTVKEGDCWLETIEIPCTSATEADRISITVKRKGKELLKAKVPCERGDSDSFVFSPKAMLSLKSGETKYE